MIMNFRILHTITIQGDGIATVKEEQEFAGDTQQGFVLYTMNTRDAAIKEALVRLGWTPPATDTAPDGVRALDDTSPGHGGPSWLGAEAARQMATQQNAPPSATQSLGQQVKYWMKRCMAAEQSLSDQGWAMDNYRHDAQIRRDEEIGRMGGGG